MDLLAGADPQPLLASDRKLLAAVHMDVAGYSRLLAIDDVGTLARLAAIRREVVEAEAQRHRGRLIQVVGDCMMLVFESIDRAVDCALRIQAAVPAVDGPRAPGEEIRFRIGVNIGDVIADGSGLHGDGINIAARLQQMSPVGGVCVSRSVHEHLQADVRGRFTPLGAIGFKNIAQPVEAFAFYPVGGSAAPPERVTAFEPVMDTALTTYVRSNDFLAAGDARRLPAMLERAREAVWFAGSTFYISVAQYRSLILRKLSQGVPIHFLILAPGGKALEPMAALLGVTAEELTLDCTSGIRVLQRTLADAHRAGHGDLLRVRLLDETFQTRFYMFDPESADGATFFVPQVGGINSQTIPGFLAYNRQAPWLASYFESVTNAWNDPRAVTLAP